MQTLSKYSSAGFTLIEMLVVMVIMMTLFALSTIGLQGARASGRDAQRKADLQDIRSALEIYRVDCGSYPSTLSFGGTNTLVGPVGTNCAGNTYMSKVPQDAQNAQGYKYEYLYASSTKTYTLCAYLEHPPAGVAAFNCGSDANSKCTTGAGSNCYYSVVNP